MPGCRNGRNPIALRPLVFNELMLGGAAVDIAADELDMDGSEGEVSI